MHPSAGASQCSVGQPHTPGHRSTYGRNHPPHNPSCPIQATHALYCVCTQTVSTHLLSTATKHTHAHTCQGLVGASGKAHTHPPATSTVYTQTHPHTQCRHRQTIKRTAARLASASTVQCVDANPSPGPRKTAGPNPGQVVDCLFSCKRTQHTFKCASADGPFDPNPAANKTSNGCSCRAGQGGLQTAVQACPATRHTALLQVLPLLLPATGPQPAKRATPLSGVLDGGRPPPGAARLGLRGKS